MSNLFLVDDILPLGKFETLPVEAKTSVNPQDFANVYQLFNITQKGLLREARDFCLSEQRSLIAERDRVLTSGCNIEETKEYLARLCFFKETFRVVSLRKLGTASLQNSAGLQTRELIREIGVPVFRQQYNVAKNGFSTAYHIDHSSFEVHGYRCLIPLNEPIYLVFLEGRIKQNYYKLTAGKAYFVNVGKLHRSFCCTDIRYALSLQMTSDRLIEKGREVDCVPESSVPKSFRNYSVDWKLWD